MGTEEAEHAVRQAVYALYTGGAGQQAQANHWLTAFQQSQDAWQVAFRLIAPDQAQEVLFFAAALLVRKVKAEWGKLQPSQRQELGQAVRSKFQEVLGWPAPPPPLVMRQLCVLLAAAAGSGGGEGAAELVAQAKALLGPATALGLELLTAVADEAEDLDRVRRLALVNVLAPFVREVLDVLGQLLAQALKQLPGAAELAVGALRCTESWLKLSQVAGSGSILTPGELDAQQPQLFLAILSALAGLQRPPAVVDAAVQVLLLVFGADTFSGASEKDEMAATTATLAALVSLRHRLAQRGAGGGADEGEVLAVGVVQLGSALAERLPEWCGGELPEAVAFSEVMLECLSRPDPAVAESSLDYFLMLNTVPLADRAAELRSPLYEAMLRAMVHHAALPLHFTRWEEEGEADQDTFVRLREQMLPEALETAYGLLRSGYLAFAWHLLQSAASWQQAEAALYLFTAVSTSVKGRVLGGGEATDSDGASSAVRQDAQQAQQLLASLFAQLCCEDGVARLVGPGGHPLLACGACGLLESYAAWFGRAQAAPLQEAFRLTLACMRLREAGAAAAKAFNSLCLRCAWRLRDPAAVASLIDAAHVLLQPQPAAAAGGAGSGSPLSMADKQAVVEGLARLVAGLPPPHLQETAARLTQPFAAHATALARGSANGSAHGGPAPSAAARQAMAEDLQLVAGALRYLSHGASLGSGGDGAAGDEAALVQPVVAVLEEVREVLAAVVASQGWHADESVAGAAAEVYRRAICSARRQGAVLLPAVLPALVALFQQCGLPACLDAVGDCAEIHYREASLAEPLAGALHSLCAAAFPRLQADLREQQGMASSLLSLADQFAVYSPALLWPSPLLPPLLQLAAACLRLREADPVSHALALLGRCLTARERDAEDDGVQQVHLEAVDTALLGCGEELVGSLLAAECDTCPRHLMRSAADCLYKLLVHPAVGPHARGWLSAVLAAAQLPGVASGQLSGEDCSTFCALVLGGTVRGARFAALVVDFGLLARGQNTPDVLLAYQM